MDLGFPTVSVREGLVDLLVPDVERRAGPGTRTGLPFYNPAMAVARDLSVLLAARLVPRDGRCLDGLAAAGALGLRVARETGADVVLNDKNPRALDLIRRNAERNGLTNVAAFSEDLNAHLSTHSYDLVEVDPFGSPVRFLDAAVLSAHRGSALGVTATDTAVLCGSKPEAARRRYLVSLRHTDAYAEVGTRVLLGYIARIAARHDKAVKSILAYAAEHFVNVHVTFSEGAARADAALGRLGFVRFHPDTGAHEVLREQASPQDLGPLWLGALADPDVLGELHESPVTGHGGGRILEGTRQEIGLPPFYADHNAMARRTGVSPPPLSRVLGALRDAGHRAVRTHFRENSLKTDAPWPEVLETYRALGS